MDSRPLARTEGLIAEALDDGVVVYDSTTQRAHSLNAAATTIWTLADGSRTIAAIAATAGVEASTAAATLERLALDGLLAEPPGLSRRSLLRRSAAVGAGAIAAVPLIETVVIPVAAAHASTGSIGQPNPTDPTDPVDPVGPQQFSQASPGPNPPTPPPGPGTPQFTFPQHHGKPQPHHHPKHHHKKKKKKKHLKPKPHPRPRPPVDEPPI